jgi:hypothetical protein
MERRDSLLALQRAAGNRAVRGLVSSGRSVLTPVREEAGQPLAASTRTQMEASFGHDFSAVRVHTGQRAHEAALSVGASAYTMGSHIVLSRAAGSPGSARGAHTLAHELAHVVQQRSGGVEGSPTPSGIRISDPGDRFERAAEESAKAVGAGRRAVAHPSRHGAGHAASVQRRIGFEIETGIPVLEKRANGKFKDPGTPSRFKVTTASQGKIVVDHVTGHTRTAIESFDNWPIVELTTDALDENQKLSAFQETAREWLSLLGHMKMRAAATPDPRPLSGSVSGAPADAVIGFPSNTKTMNEGGFDRVSVQATVGARLDRMGAMMAQIANPPPQGRGGADADRGMTVGQASTAMPAVMAAVPGGSKKDRAEMEGFLVLIVNYLLAGANRIQGGYIKNRTMLFYKAPLSEVAAALTATDAHGKTANKLAGSVLGDATKRKALRNALLAATQRNPGDKVVNFNNIPTCKVWIDGVLTGTDDQVFERARNPYSDVLHPENVNKHLGMVMEFRSPGAVFPEASNQAMNLDRPDEIVSFMSTIFVQHKQWQDFKKK